MLVGGILLVVGVILFYSGGTFGNSELAFWLSLVLFIGGFVVLYPAVRSAVGQFSTVSSPELTVLLEKEGWKISDNDRTREAKFGLPSHMLAKRNYQPVEILWSAERTIDGTNVHLFYRRWKDTASRHDLWWTDFDLHLTLLHPLSGWVQAEPVSSLTKINPEIQLESNKFNDRVDVIADPAKLASMVFAPDTMEWYLETSSQPFIHLEGNQLVVMPNNESEDGTEKVFVQITRSLEDAKYVQRKMK